jgi:hypothetical protein
MSIRILCVLAVAVALAGTVVLAPRVAEPSRAPTPAAFIDLGAIFSGDENEPDENETGDDAAARQQPPSQGRGAHISLVGVLISAAAGAIAALFLASRLRRLRDRLRSWGVRRGLTADRRH